MTHTNAVTTSTATLSMKPHCHIHHPFSYREKEAALAQLTVSKEREARMQVAFFLLSLVWMGFVCYSLMPYIISICLGLYLGIFKDELKRS